MPSSNVTSITEFVVLGFPGLQPAYNGPVSALMFFVYLAIVAGNSFILILVSKERCLQKPSYLIYCNLAISDIAFATTTLPKMIARYWAEAKTVSFTACFLQMFLVHFLGSVNSVLLMIMALDRYVAICNPLRYHVLIKNSTILALCGLAWLVCLFFMALLVYQAVSLSYCSSNVIVQCYCDHIGITRLACENVKEVQLTAFIVAMTILLCPLAFIVFSYIVIIISVFKIADSEGRYKTFSTCSPQLFIIGLYYIPRCFVYIANNIKLTISTDFRILMIILYSLIPPMVNPLIYCFRTKEIKDTLVRRWKIRKVGRVAGHS
ncbi:olfactory receptor 2AT4-like [Brienomyrus brachyistius]|uniref:olfactory receptor 2AT4-like n=1 Tax=Brienomyrus brachyistius TaxID=42636 RepID=UPI0020B1BE30|nr:olfactory receptor 2AT4-like [Brienomyrus brachyistius]